MNEYKPTIKEFLNDIKDHQLTIKLDQGVYRHLVCANKNGSWNQRFEIITAPHTLLIRGDMGAVAFSRVEDMFTFFSGDPDRINPSYWGEKIEGLQYDGTRLAYRFDWEHFRDTLVDSLDGYGISEDEKAKIVERMDYEIEWSDDESHVRRQVEDFVEVDGGFKFQDTWEIDAVKPLYRYIWLCRAICWAIREYRKTKENVNG